ncbi:MAG: SDR family NAD(P)-dependent oxidoreductase [Clostridia bacterium]|nr:SDR family NAD(P)-dependent oxidoreductase [Clostridia bacterium]
MKDKIVRNVVITGGTSGIGKSCYEYFSSKGDNVIILARKNPEKLPNFYVCDVTDEMQVMQVFNTIGTKYACIDVLINNAGFGISGATELVDEKTSKDMFNVNYFGVVNCYKYALPYMKKGSTIINLSSVCAFFPLPFRGHYCASKSAVNMITYSQRMECNPFGVKVTAVCPGDVKTNFTKNRVKNFETNERYGDRIKNAAESIDSKDDKRMKPIVVAKAVYKQSKKRNPKPYTIVGTKYKILNFAMRFLPLNLLLRFTSKFFGGFKNKN